MGADGLRVPGPAPHATPFEALAQRWLERNVSYGVLTTDTQGVIRSFNRWLERATGRNASDVIGLRLVEAFPEIEERNLWNFFEEALEGHTRVLSQRLHEYLLRVRTDVAGFSWMQQSVQIAPLADDSQFVGTIVVITDVTERVAREQKLREEIAARSKALEDEQHARAAAALASEELRERAEELETVLRSVPAAIWISSDAACTQIRSNPEGAKLLRSPVAANVSASGPPDLVRARPFREITPDGRPLASDELPLQVAARTGEDVKNAELSFLFDDGEVRHAFGNATALRGADGNVRGVVAAFIDVTDLRQTERERDELLARERSLREQAERAASLAEMFVAVVGHDLRNPLSAIYTGSSYLAETAQTDREKRVLQRVLRSVQRMTRMIDQILDLSRIRSGSGLAMKRAHCDLRLVAERCREEIAAGRPAIVDIETRGSSVGEFDADRLEQVLSNLIGNAVEHSPAGAHVQMNIDGSDPKLVSICVQNPSTIAKEDLCSLFEPFRRGRSGTSSGGIGLGLYITRAIVEAHGGTVDVSSSAEEGTRFCVRLPRSDPKDGASSP